MQVPVCYIHNIYEAQKQRNISILYIYKPTKITTQKKVC